MPLSEKTLARFQRPTHAGSLNRSDPTVVSVSVESPERGDVIQLQVRLDAATTLIEAVRFRVFGCPSLIAAADLAAEWMEGWTLEQAAAIRSETIAKELELPEEKRFSADLTVEAIRATVRACEASLQGGIPGSATAQCG